MNIIRKIKDVLADVCFALYFGIRYRFPRNNTGSEGEASPETFTHYNQEN